ncbi:MAG TPA: hypothetical protein VJ866_23060 [Pyrinomonadaceae bacterium]|nr:hypothetical protein [Pyrinomonadaceae bacterium]
MHTLSALRIFLLAFGIIILFATVSLSGAAGRMFGFEDRAGASVMLSLALTLAIANAVIIVKARRTLFRNWAGVVIYPAFLVGVGAVSAYKAYTSTPPYLIENIAIKVTVHDVAGTTGDAEARVQLKPLRDDVRDIRWGGPSSTGVIKNVAVKRVNGDFTPELMQEGGQWQFSLPFAKPPKRGQRVNFLYSFDVVGAEPEDKTEWVHDVTWPTQNLEIKLIVPKERPCKTVNAYSHKAEQISVDMRDESSPLLFNDNSEVQWAKVNPQEGRSYVVVCHQ